MFNVFPEHTYERPLGDLSPYGEVRHASNANALFRQRNERINRACRGRCWQDNILGGNRSRKGPTLDLAGRRILAMQARMHS